MEWIDEDFGRCWNELADRLDARLRPMTLSFFDGVPAGDARRVADLVGDGKKLRGCLVLAVCDALGGSLDAALPGAVAVECVQAASLIHDDLVDDDAVRRERPATWTVEGGRRAVLLGDLIFATALYRSAEMGREQVLVLTKAIALMAAGAYREPLDALETETLLRQRPDASSLYEHIIRAKTGALFAAAAELGAIAAAAPNELRVAAAAFGARIGEAYQMADDLADLVTLPDAAGLSPQQSAARAIVTASLGGAAPQMASSGALASEAAASEAASPETASAAAATAVARAVSADPAGTLQREIRRRVGLAEGSVSTFPEGPRLAFLRAIPGAFVRGR